MAFTSSSHRYASFGVITSVDAPIVDVIWGILDNALKDTFPLPDHLHLSFQNRGGQLTIRVELPSLLGHMDFDYAYPFDPYGPGELLLIDEDGEETLLLPYELDHY